MPDKDVIMIRQKELKRLHVIQKVEDGELTQVEAADILSISDRQVRRLLKRIKDEGLLRDNDVYLSYNSNN
ncbi:integrase catalytic region, partial [Candidatus Magnetobacterium bavaricum]